MRVIIVGAGMGGLAASIALRKAGFETLVLEQAPALTPVGAGINLAANAMMALTSLGADQHVRNKGVKGEQELYLDLLSGDSIARRQLLGPKAAAKYGDVYHSVHRADLVDALVAQVAPEDLKLNARVESFEEDEKGVKVYLDGGEVVEGDLLIAADGIKSKIRGALFGKDEPKFMGVQGWRTIIPRSSLPSHMPPSEGLCAWLGVGRLASMYPIRKDLIYGGAFVPAAEVREESWSSEGGIDELRAAFDGACADVHSYIDAIEKSAQTLFLTSINYRDPLDTWCTKRVALLGDSAHPGPPAAGQGAAMAMEDAIVLAGCLKKHKTNVSDGLMEYQQRRMPRTRRIVESAVAMMRATTMSDPLQLSARNGRFRGLAQLDPLGETSFGWMAGYNAEASLDLSIEEVTRPAGDLVNPLKRPEARRAFDFWRNALTVEDRSRGWMGERAGFERSFNELSNASASAKAKKIDDAGVTGLLVGNGEGPLVLHLHGGGFNMGAASTAVSFAQRLSEKLGGPVFVPEYRLAPEYPFPAAQEDTLAAYQWLAKQYGESRSIVVTGECAGGGLAVSLALRLRDDKSSQMPVKLCVVSPLADLSLSSAVLNSKEDAWFDRNSLTVAAASYLHNQNPREPLVSPALADLSGLPPMLIFAAEGELLQGDAKALNKAAETASVPTELVIVKDSVHSFVLFDFLPESREAIEKISKFVS